MTYHVDHSLGNVVKVNTLVLQKETHMKSDGTMDILNGRSCHLAFSRRFEMTSCFSEFKTF